MAAQLPAPPPTTEARLQALEQAVAGQATAIGRFIAANTGKISTKLAGILTTAVAVLTFVATQPLPDWAHLGVTAIATGIAAYETAENT